MRIFGNSKRKSWQARGIRSRTPLASSGWGLRSQTPALLLPPAILILTEPFLALNAFCYIQEV